MQLIEEIARHLHNNQIGSLGTTLFYSYIPGLEGTYSVMVKDTGGMNPDIDILDIEHPTFQIFIRSTTYDVGKDLLNSVRGLLHGVINEYLLPGGIYYRKIHALAEGGHLGKNEAGYHEFSINFEALIIR